MKMNKTLLLKASAFFLLLITLLFSCGIPTYFYVNYYFTKGSDLAIDTVAGKFTFTDTSNNLSWIDPGTGPSLMLAYCVTTSTNDPQFYSLFATKYKRTNNNGIPVSEDELLSYDNGGYIYRLHRFSDNNGIDFRSPQYTAYATNPNSPDFEVSLAKDSSTNLVDISFTSGNYSILGSTKLARSIGTSAFETDIQKIKDQPGNFPDYTIIDASTANKLYCHVFAAVNVSQGDFSNNFWTDLKHLGYIQLN